MEAGETPSVLKEKFPQGVVYNKVTKSDIFYLEDTSFQHISVENIVDDKPVHQPREKLLLKLEKRSAPNSGVLLSERRAVHQNETDKIQQRISIS